MKLLLKEAGDIKKYMVYDALYHSRKTSQIFIHYSLVDEDPVFPSPSQEQKPMLIDNSTPVPVVDAEGYPVLITQLQHTGQYAQLTDPENGTYTDYNQPIMAEVELPKTIGEYDAVMWWLWDIRNSTPHSSIEAMILEGMKRRLGLSQTPYVFVQTPEWLATIPV